MFGVEFKMSGMRKWRKCSLEMRDRAAIEQQAKLLAVQESWSEWRIIERKI